jgi:hypothetical protein
MLSHPLHGFLTLSFLAVPFLVVPATAQEARTFWGDEVPEGWTGHWPEDRLTGEVESGS